ncbi:MAG TPA: G5 domain-containing protein [Candidatus Limnocylindria bacterium]|nr:G5 domain-containing protein [Candidatus Limnocylindria bacterium]
MAALLRVVALSLVTFIVFAASWQLAAIAGAHTRGAVGESALRADPQGRGLSPGARAGILGDTPGVRLTPGGTALVLSPGFPLTVIDRGTATPVRASRGSTVGDVLALLDLKLGPLDQVVAREDGPLVAGDVVRVLRVSESLTVVREAVPYAVRTVADSSLAAGRVVVSVPGAPGLADNTYRVRVVDGTEAERELVASAVVQEPVTEVRRVGTRPPPGPAEIVAIIRNAAAAWGADPDQLLRVAYCESRYNPDAYNASSGASGLFQFMPRTWAANSVRAGYGGASVFDPVANANTAAYMFANGQAGQWSCK